jgi:hypothetical protein
MFRLFSHHHVYYLWSRHKTNWYCYAYNIYHAVEECMLCGVFIYGICCVILLILLFNLSYSVFIFCWIVILIFSYSVCHKFPHTLCEFNNIHPNIKFTIETHNTINFLDLSINKTGNNLQLGIYRKPPTTDLIIHNDSCHPFEHKKAAINFLVNRLNQYPLTHNNKHSEENIIRTILQNNNYPLNTIQLAQKPPNKYNNIQKRKWATFTYFRHQIRTITNLFKNTEVGASYKTKNNIKHLLKSKNNKDDILWHYRKNIRGIIYWQERQSSWHTRKIPYLPN